MFGRRFDEGEIEMDGITVGDVQETMPRHDAGIDWGAKRRLLARSADKRTMLFVVEGHSAPLGARGFGREYHRARICLYAHKGWGISPSHRWDTLATGRVNLTELKAKHGALIDRVFGCPGLSDKLETRKTLVVEPKEATAA